MSDPTSLAWAGTLLVTLLRELRERKNLRRDDIAALLQAAELVGTLQAGLAERDQEIARLRRQLDDVQERRAEHDHWERRYVGRAWVMAPLSDPAQTTDRAPPGPYLCPTCFSAGDRRQLGPVPGGWESDGSHYCTKCHTFFDLRG